MIDQLPTSVGGEPAGAPARPARAYEYPAVHDMPPPRATQAMDEETEYKAEKDLAAVRDRQEALTATDQPAPVPPKKKKAAAHDRPANAQDGATTKP